MVEAKCLLDCNTVDGIISYNIRPDLENYSKPLNTASDLLDSLNSALNGRKNITSSKKSNSSDLGIYCDVVLDTGSYSSWSPFVFFLNICSLKFKTHLLEEYILTLKALPIICIAEHWMNEEAIKYVQFLDYSLGNAYCRLSKRGGGVCIYVPMNTDYTVFSDISFLNIDSLFECCAIRLVLNNVPWIIVTVYRTLACKTETFLSRIELLCFTICKKGTSIVIAGDFNLNLLDESSRREDFLNVMSSYNLRPLVRTGTRPGLSGNSCIDNIFTNSTMNIMADVSSNVLSDHHCITVNTEMYMLQNDKSIMQNSDVYYMRDLSIPALNKLKTKLSEVEWNNVLPKDGVNGRFKMFMDVILVNFNDCCKVKKFKVDVNRKNREWFTEDLIAARNDTKLLYDLYKADPVQINKDNYNIGVKKYKGMIRKAKSDHINNKISNAKNKGKAVWNEINKLLKTKKTASNITIVNANAIITEPQKVAELMNDFFINCSNNEYREPNMNVKDYLGMNIIQSMAWFPVSSLDIHSVLDSMPNKKSSGPDGVPIQVVKHCINSIETILVELFNESLMEGIFPDVLKIAKVIPIFKKGDKRVPSNYRPITMQPCFTKIFESLVKKMVDKYLNGLKIITDRQFGFVNGKSTTKAIASYIEQLCISLELNESNITLYADMSKAFDTVNHNTLLCILEHYGLRGIVLQWFESYLKNRLQHVEITHNNSCGFSSKICSENQVVLSGVPQGSVLGPLLFVIYVNSLVNVSANCFTTMFADDFTFLIVDSNEDLLINKTKVLLDNIEIWSNTLNLTINASKTFYLQTSLDYVHRDASNNSLNLKLRDSNISKVDLTKFLGINIDNRLNWKAHTDALAKKLNSICYAIKVIKMFVSVESALTVYNAYFHSIMQYGIIFWANSSKTNFNKIFLTQKRAIRSIAGVTSTKSCKPFFVKYNILTLASVYILELATYIKDNILKLNCNKDLHSHKTRTKNRLHINFCKKSVTYKNHLYFGIKIYNKLPLDLCNLDMKSFRRKLKEILIGKVLYSIEEFFLCDIN